MSITVFDDKLPVSIQKWMHWASGDHDAEYRVMLPMIQRGSVWAPHKILDLWDTLLRGMPIGAMMASEAKVGEEVRDPTAKGTHQAKTGDINLIDGQQRTLAMLSGKCILRERPACIWVDLIDSPQGEYLFRLWATTRSQPYGYARATMGGQPLGKLERQKLRLANQTWETRDPLTLWKEPDFMPWDAKFALPLPELMNNRIRLQDFVQEKLAAYSKALEAKLNHAPKPEDEIALQIFKHQASKLETIRRDSDLEIHILRLKDAIDVALKCEFPIIHVRRETFDKLETQSEDINIDPPLAILFKRVGTSGEPLSNADYVYSVIKHHAQEVHNMVEKLLEDQQVSAIYTPTALVMSAVRMTILTFKVDDSAGKKIADSAKLDKAAFARLVRNHKEFIKEFKKTINEKGNFVSNLKQVLEILSYVKDHEYGRLGLPKHALRLIPIPLLETILAWCILRNPTDEAMQQSLLPLIRFVLQGNLCVLDYAKASEVAIKVLKGDPSMLEFARSNSLDMEKLVGDEFPDQALLELFTKGDKATAWPLPSPERLKNINDRFGYPLTKTPDDVKGLRGWSRFAMHDDASPEDKACAAIYKRWWCWKGGHIHPMLLWLQRDYVATKFEDQPALAGMDEEIPFDFDHLLPSAQWSYWTGADKQDRFINYPLKANNILDNTGHWHIGNSIGNIHVLESSENRSWGDASICVKLAVKGFAKNACIPESDNNNNDWVAASGNEGEPRKWIPERALAFQRAVEKRAFALYSKFYADLFPPKAR